MISTLPRRVAPIAVLATGLGSAAVALAPAARADTTTMTWYSSGAEQSWTVPAGVASVHVVAVGGHGGMGQTEPAGGDSHGAGGAGAVVTADLDVVPGHTLYLEVGGNGQDLFSDGSAATGGFNGGGNAPLDTNSGRAGGGGGGGASDVRTLSMVDGSTLTSRLLIAGGGGGGGIRETGGDSAENGSAGTYHTDPTDPSACPVAASGQPGGGGDQNSPGDGGTANGGTYPTADGQTGSFGRGGDGGASDFGASGGAGGGGGYYGGGGGGGGGTLCTGSGGGGSSLVDSTSGHNVSYGTDTSGTPRITISYLVPLAPLATTEPASSVGQTTATLNGVVNPEGFATSYHFAYGTDPNNESQTTADTQVDPTDSAQHDVSATIPGLSPGTTYYFRLVTHNDNGDASGQDLPFTTTAATATGRTPLATTSPASSVGWTKAQLNGVVNARGALTSYYFQWGTTTAYGQTTPAQNVGPAWGNHAVKAQLTGLTRHTTYHFRLVATNANGTVQGVDRTFRTS